MICVHLSFKRIKSITTLVESNSYARWSIDECDSLFMALSLNKDYRDKMLHVVLLFPEFCGLSESVNTPRQLLNCQNENSVIAFDPEYSRERMGETNSQKMNKLLMQCFNIDCNVEQVINAFQYDHVFSHWLILQFLVEEYDPWTGFLYLYDVTKLPLDEVKEQAESLLAEILPHLEFREFSNVMLEFRNIMRERIESRKEYQFKFNSDVSSLIEQSYEASDSPLHHLLLFFVNWYQWEQLAIVDVYESETQQEDDTKYNVNNNNDNDWTMAESCVTSIEEMPLSKRKCCDTEETVQVKFVKT